MTMRYTTITPPVDPPRCRVQRGRAPRAFAEVDASSTSVATSTGDDPTTGADDRTNRRSDRGPSHGLFEGDQ